MKLHTNNYGFEGNLPEDRIDMKIENSAMMYEILSSGIYKDKILAVIREYICNAFDAHVSVGKHDVPLTVRLPNSLDPTFSVTDEGTGVDPKMIGKIFWTYGRSTKTEDDNTIGALGLGSKSAFAYTKSSFIVKNNYEGVEYTYLCFINEKGTPQGSKVGEVPTSNLNGITVEFAIRLEDVGAFHTRFSRIYKYWANVKPKIIGVDLEDLNLEEPTKVIEGSEWYLEGAENSYDRHPALAIMGNVSYPIESSSIPNLPLSLKIIADNPFVVTFKLGDLEFASSRESLSYTEFTCKKLIARLEEVRSELANSFYNKVFTASKDHLSFYRTFMSTFAEFRKVVHVSNDYSAIDSRDETFIKLLLDKSLDDSIEFKGTEFLINDLIEGRYSIRRDDFYQPYGMYNPTTRGSRSTRFFLAPSTFLTMSLKEEANAEDYFPSRSYKLDIGTIIIDRHDWRSKFISPRTEIFSSFDLALKNFEKILPSTWNTFKINPSASELTFIVNDVGTSGRDRLKALDNIASTNDNIASTLKQTIYVEFNSKITTVEGVVADLNSLIEETLTGATVIYLSNLPDGRPPVVKAKIDRESIKLKVISFVRAGESKEEIQVSNLNNITLKINRFNKERIIDSIVKLDDLRSRKVVPFVIKRRVRDKFFRDVGDSHVEYLSGLLLPAHFGAFDDAIVEEKMSVLIINEGQHAYLTKKGIKLKSIHSLILTKIEALEATENFTLVVSRLTILSKVRHLEGMYDGLKFNHCKELTNGWESSSSPYKILFAEYCNLRDHCKSHAEAFGKMMVLSAVKSLDIINYSSNAEKIQEQINDQYPMLKLINYSTIDCLSKTIVKTIINYIEQIDTLINVAVQDTERELIDARD